MSHPEPLPATALRRLPDERVFGFDHTGELEPVRDPIGQDRAIEALRFGMRMQQDGYGMFVLGPAGTGRHEAVERILEQHAAALAPPSDWCYVHDFDDPQRPRAMRLPTGLGVRLRDDMAQLIEDAREAIPTAFEGDDYRTRRDSILDEFKERQEQAFADLHRRAEAKGLVVIRTPDGLAVAPMRDGQIMEKDAFDALSKEEQQRVDAELTELRKDLQAVVRAIPKAGQEQRERLRALDRDVTELAVGHLIDALRARYAELPDVHTYLDAVRDDLVEHSHEFVQGPAMGFPAMLGLPPDSGAAKRYRVNLLVGHNDGGGAPVVYEDQPSHHRLVGRIEHVSQFGALVTDFTLIKPGALHRANGGFLILDAHRLLVQPFAYEELKRVLRSGSIRIESLAEKLSLVSTTSIEPEPIPLDVKVVLVGERMLYYVLSSIDPDFGELFKVPVDFEESIESTDDAVQMLARTFARHAVDDGLRHLDRSALSRVVEHASREVADQRKLTTRVRDLRDLHRESDFFAAEAGRERIVGDDVERAIAARIRRADRLRERVHERIRRGTVRVEVAGERIGQVNGLSVIQLGSFAFGSPSRITARVRLGKGDVVDIEREVDLGGPIHSKGVLILAGFLGQRFATEHPLCLSASLVFEQSYAGVEGDSASSAELYALLSALAGIPLRQSLAVTGSVDQHGGVQAVGGINEKVEGFFDVCRAKGLTGVQGVLIPASNVEHLMLRRDLVEAVEAGSFQVFAVENVDEGIELLTGVPAGARGDDGTYPEGSVNRAVHDRLRRMAATLSRFGKDGQV